MGQRLVVTIQNEGRDIAAIYYHWSAYTHSALYETRKIINCIYNHLDETEDQILLKLIRFVEDDGGCIRGSEKEHKYIQSLYPDEKFKDEGSRNNGLIALSEDGIRDLQSWSEGDVYIQLDNDMVDFRVYSGYESLEEYIEERKSWDNTFDEEEFKNIPKLDCCLGHFDVDEIDDVIAKLDSVGNEYVIQCGDEICALIE